MAAHCHSEGGQPQGSLPRAKNLLQLSLSLKHAVAALKRGQAVIWAAAQDIKGP